MPLYGARGVVFVIPNPKALSFQDDTLLRCNAKHFKQIVRQEEFGVFHIIIPTAIPTFPLENHHNPPGIASTPDTIYPIPYRADIFPYGIRPIPSVIFLFRIGKLSIPQRILTITDTTLPFPITIGSIPIGTDSILSVIDTISVGKDGIVKGM